MQKPQKPDYKTNNKIISFHFSKLIFGIRQCRRLFDRTSRHKNFKFVISDHNLTP